jgi:hypothetical protein
LLSTIRSPGPRLIGFRPRAGLEGIAMETFTQLFGDLLYHEVENRLNRMVPIGADGTPPD